MQRFALKFASAARRFRRDESGVLSFEWILLATLLVIGVIGGMAAFRDTAVLQLGNLAQAAGRLDQSCGYEGCPYLKDQHPIVDSRAQTATPIVTVEQE